VDGLGGGDVLDRDALRAIPSVALPSGWTHATVIPPTGVQVTSAPRVPDCAGAAAWAAANCEPPVVRCRIGWSCSTSATAQPWGMDVSWKLDAPLAVSVWGVVKAVRPTRRAAVSIAVTPGVPERESWWRRQTTRTWPRASIAAASCHCVSPLAVASVVSAPHAPPWRRTRARTLPSRSKTTTWSPLVDAAVASVLARPVPLKV